MNTLYNLHTILLLAVAAFSTNSHAVDTKARTTNYEYNAQGQLTKEIREPSVLSECLVTDYVYDTFGNRTSASSKVCAGASGSTAASAANPRANSSSFSADGRFATGLTNALNQSETRGFDGRFGVINSLTGPNGLTTVWQMDEFGRKTQELRADGTKTVWSYLRCGDTGANCPATLGSHTVTWVMVENSYAVNQSINAPERRQFYDQLGRLLRIQTEGFDTTGVVTPLWWQDTQYDEQGRVSRQSEWYSSTDTPVWQNYTYDVLGRMLSESHPEKIGSTPTVATSSTTYAGLTTVSRNANNQTKTTVKNALGQVQSVTDSLGSTITYQYDALGNLTQTNAAGSVTAMQYDLRGNKVAMQDPAMGSWTYAYNAYGELVSQRDSLSQSTALEYDSLGRLVKRVEPDLVSQWSYDLKFDATPCG
ncbi:MAG: type IV secretion protein Rhs, partial [Betaproteobacteria bacterium]|nr:type IV secretion protein Rhs [Betaproteobacteria bacterium]